MRNEFVAQGYIRTKKEFDKVLGTMIDNGYLIRTENGNIGISEASESYIAYLNSLIWPFIDTYWLTFEFILSLAPSKFVQQGLIFTKVQALATAMYKEGVISFYESCSQEIIKNAIATFDADGVIAKKRLQTSISASKGDQIYTLADTYLDQEKMERFKNQISFYRKPCDATEHTITKIKKLVLSEFPTTAKL